MAQQLWLVRTTLDFIEVFRRCPRFNPARDEWMDFGRVYVFGTLYWRLDVLALQNILRPNVRRSVTLGPATPDSIWTFSRTAAGLMDLHVGEDLLETYCPKTMRAFRMHHLPVGVKVGLTFDPPETPLDPAGVPT